MTTKTIASYQVQFALATHTGPSGPKHPHVVLKAVSFDDDASFPSDLRHLAFTISASDFQRQQDWRLAAVPSDLQIGGELERTWNDQARGADMRIAIEFALGEHAGRYFAGSSVEATKVNGAYILNLVGRSSMPRDPNLGAANRLDPSTAQPKATNALRPPRSLRKTGASAMLKQWF